MATGPSPRVRREFRKYVTNTLASEGEPAALGKSASGPVYYTDYDDVEHKNRVWFRKGTNKEIVGVARADNQGVPNVPDLPIRVARRFGMDWVVGWQRENPAVPAAGGGSGEPMQILLNATDLENNVGWTYRTYQGIAGPTWEAPNNSTNKRLITAIPCPYDTASIRVEVFYHMQGNFTGVNRLELDIGHLEDGVTASSAAYAENSTTTTEDVSPPPDSSTPDVWGINVTLTDAFNAGDLIGIALRRMGNSSGTTNTGTMQLSGIRITFLDVDVGGGSTGTGVHEFHASEIMPADNTTLEHDAAVTRPFIEFPDSVVGTALMSFLAEKTNASFNIDVYSVSGLGGSGDVVLDADVYRAATDGTESPGDDNAFVSSAAYTHDGFIQTHSITVAFSGGATTAPGDYCSAVLIRIGNSTTPADNLTDDLHVLMVVVTENGDG